MLPNLLREAPKNEIYRILGRSWLDFGRVFGTCFGRFWHRVLDNQQNFFNCFAVLDTFVGTSLSFEFCAPPARVRSRGGPGWRHDPPAEEAIRATIKKSVGWLVG